VCAVTDLRLGRWEDVLADVAVVDAVIVDAPYSEKTHVGADASVDMSNSVYVSKDGIRRTSTAQRRALSYSHWSPADVRAFVDSWAPRNRGWFVCLSDNQLCPAYEQAFESNGFYAFAPVGILIPGMTVRMAGDGPSSWMIYANVARPKRLSKWGTLPGGYTGGPGERVHIGGKPLWLMRALVRDYSKPGDLVVDPCAGAATTLLAAGMENRRAIGAECDPATYELARKRIAAGYTPSLDFGDAI
jgi:site-specific DNA-methyltransferase (adenine-specific)